MKNAQSKNAPLARLLIVGEPINRSLASALLREECEILWAPNGRQALQMLAQRSVAVVCTDLKLPDTSGLQLLRRVAAKYLDIATTLVADLRDFNKQERLPGDTFLLLTKPCDPAKFAMTIRTALRLARLKQAFGSITSPPPAPPAPGPYPAPPASASEADQLAHRYGVSTGTIDTWYQEARPHIANAFRHWIEATRDLAQERQRRAPQPSSGRCCSLASPTANK